MDHGRASPIDHCRLQSLDSVRAEKKRIVTAPTFLREKLPDLPPLAWLFDHPRESHGRLFHGQSVQVHDHGFFEGCMEAGMDDDPGECHNVFGSGLKILGQKWLFLTPSHTLESLYVYRHVAGWSVSNSLAFLLAYHRIMPPWDPGYGGRFASLCLGIDAYETSLFRTAEDGEVLRLVYDNAEFTSDGSFVPLRKPMPPPFRSYLEYEDYLQTILQLLFGSAADRDRETTYQPLATCSSGYDSACAAALAARLGCDEAVTLVNSNSGLCDSGKPVGERLGLQVHEFTRREIVEGSFGDVASFLATGMSGKDYCYFGFDEMLHRRVLLTGFHGDKVWDVNTEAKTELARGDLSGSS
jgi:hypothetical protein